MVSLLVVPLFKYWIIFLLLVGATEKADQARTVQAAQRVSVGMSRDEVREILGAPDIDYRPTWDHWCYGMSIEIEDMLIPNFGLNPIPVRFRLFSYAEDDVVVRWGLNDRVQRIDRPRSLEVPESFFAILDCARFVQSVDAFVRSN